MSCIYIYSWKGLHFYFYHPVSNKEICASVWFSDSIPWIGCNHKRHYDSLSKLVKSVNWCFLGWWARMHFFCNVNFSRCSPSADLLALPARSQRAHISSCSLSKGTSTRHGKKKTILCNALDQRSGLSKCIQYQSLRQAGLRNTPGVKRCKPRHSSLYWLRSTSFFFNSFLEWRRVAFRTLLANTTKMIKEPHPMLCKGRIGYSPCYQIRQTAQSRQNEHTTSSPASTISESSTWLTHAKLAGPTWALQLFAKKTRSTALYQSLQLPQLLWVPAHSFSETSYILNQTK